jgi:Arc-like DNA binding domain
MLLLTYWRYPVAFPERVHFMVRSHNREKPRAEWRAVSRLPDEFREPLMQRAEANGTTLFDEVVQAIEAHLTKPIQPQTQQAFKDRRLTKLDHYLIRKRWKRNNETQASLAREYGVSRQRIHFICQAGDPGGARVIRIVERDVE